MALSYSFHISNSKNAINTSMQLSKRLQHNLRSYSQQKLKEKSYNREKNFVLLGPDNATKAFEKFKNFYSKTFDEAVNEYNETKKKSRDKIENYFYHISNSKKSELAIEIIIQVGDMEFWKTKSYEEQKKMNKIFQSQIKKLKNELPNFKILSVVAHYDESSPHIQLIGVPIAYYKKGLKVRATKGKVFNKESLKTLQDKMREDVLEQMQELYGKDIDLKAKEKGRNHDLLIKDYIKLKQEQEKQLNSELEPLRAEQNNLKTDINKLSDKKDKIKEEITTTQEELRNSQTILNMNKKKQEKELQEQEQEKQKLANEINKLKLEKDSIQKLKNDFNSAKSLVREQNMKVFESIKFETIEQKTGLFTSEQRKVCDASVVRRLIDNNETAIKIDSDKIDQRINNLEIQDREIKREHEDYTNLIRFLKKIPFLKKIISKWYEKQYNKSDLNKFEKELLTVFGNKNINKTKDYDNDFEK